MTLSQKLTAALANECSRRAFLQNTGVSVGAMALSALLPAGQLPAAETNDKVEVPHWPGVTNPLHFAPRAKRVIHLYMAGGPSHLDTLDYKPKLAELHGQPMPASYTKGQPIAQLQGRELKCFGPQHRFRRFGASGQSLAEVFPHIGSVADELCIIRSLRTGAINHDPAHTFMNTGTTISGRPAMGSWLLYGLGTPSEDLPGFVVLSSVGKAGQAQPIAARQWHSGFLPSRFQGVEFRSAGDPVLYVTNPGGVNSRRQRDVVDAVQALNRIQAQTVPDAEIATRIAQYELAFRMQTSVPGLMDVSGESRETLELYGTEGADGSYGANCLLARRLVERGVRFVQVYHRAWDHHGGIKRNIAATAKEVDRASAALIKDLKARGMLDDTLVLWGGEFGRTPMSQGGSGRDHHMKGFSMWMAGGGVQGGISYGNTDELGYNAEENIVEVHDLHATMLRLLGVEHQKLTYRFQGRDFRLTDVHGKVVEKILA
jgi:hypothetical protein